MEKYEVGKIIKGKVTGIENYGIFLNIDNKYTGLIHISEISEQYVKNVQDYVNLNEKIKARIIGIDVKNNQLKLSIKDVKNYRYSKKNNNQGSNDTSCPEQCLLPGQLLFLGFVLSIGDREFGIKLVHLRTGL